MKFLESGWIGDWKDWLERHQCWVLGLGKVGKAKEIDKCTPLIQLICYYKPRS